MVSMKEKIPVLRAKFLEELSEVVTSGAYHADDIERLRTEDVYAERFLRHQKGDVENVVAMIDVSFKWRKEMGLNDLTEKSFPAWIHEMGALYYRNEDKEGKKILYFDVSKTRKEPDKYPIVKQFIGWWLDKQFLTDPSSCITPLFDLSHAGLSNMDMELIKFQIGCFTKYYPAILEYMLVYEMPWVLNVIWKVIRPLLNPAQQKAVVFVRKAEIQDYIDKDQLWPHMGGTDQDFTFHYIPSGDSGIDLAWTDETNDVNENEDNDTKQKRVSFLEEPEPAENDPSETDGHKIDRPSVCIDDLLYISPPDFLQFDVPAKPDDFILLKNETEKTIAYKIKTTSPMKFKVRPSVGMLRPKVSSKIKISSLAKPTDYKTMQKNDKFLVMFIEVPNTTSSKPVKPNDVFRRATQDQVHNHRLHCDMIYSAIEDELPVDPIQMLMQKIDNLTDCHQRTEAKVDAMLQQQRQFLRYACGLLILIAIIYYLCTCGIPFMM